MAGIDYSGGSGYSPFGGDEPKKHKHKKHKKKRGILGLADNFLTDIGDTVMGIPEGVRTIAETGYHDTKDLFDGGGHDFKLDDLGKEAIKQITYTYEPLTHGDFKEFGRRLYEHPLGPVLDAFTIATLGAGAEVRAAKILGDVGEVGKVSRLTGGTVRAVREGENAADTLDLLRAGQPWGMKKAGRVSRDGTRIEEPAPRTLSPRRTREDGGEVGVVGVYAENPVRRLQQRAYDALTEAIPGWAERRVTHANRKARRDVSAREQGRAGFDAADKLLHENRKHFEKPEGQATALAVRDAAEGKVNDAELDRLEREHARIQEEGDAPEREARIISSVVGKRKGEAAVPAVLDHVADIEGKKAALNERIVELTAPLSKQADDAENVNDTIRMAEGDGAMQSADHVEPVDLAFILDNALVEKHDGSLAKIDEAFNDEQAVRAADLKDDIAEHGMDQPIEVKLTPSGSGTKFVVTDGVARLLAASELKRPAVPVRLTVEHRAANARGRRPKHSGAVTRDNRMEIKGRPEFEAPGDWGMPVYVAEQAGPTVAKTRAEAIAAAERRVNELERRSEILRKAAPDPDKALREAKQLVTMRANRDIHLPEMETRIELRRAIKEGRLKPDATLVEALLATLRPVAESTTDLLKEGGVKVRPLEERLGIQRQIDALEAEYAELPHAPDHKKLEDLDAEERADLARADEIRDELVRLHQQRKAVEEDGFPVPHGAERSGARAAKQAAANKRNPSAPRRPDSSRFNSGFNERFGLDALRLENILVANRAAREWVTAKKAWEEVVSQAVPRDPLAPVPKGWRAIPKGHMERVFNNARAFLDDEAPVMFGEDSAVVHAMREQIVAGLGEKLTDGPLMVPEKLYAKTLREMEPRKRIPGFDQAVGVWRMSVVSPLRPAFLVNNFIGQSLLLGVAHASFSGLRDMMKYGSDPEVRAFIDGYMGAVRGSGQARVLGDETSAMLAGQGRYVKAMKGAKNFQDAMTRFGQAMTDDPFRRMAFAAEALPPARKILKRAVREGRTVIDEATGQPRPFVMQDALKLVLEDEKSISRIERKVLTDLVDFDDLTRSEREIVRRVLPFYSWIKGSSKLTIQLALNNPLYAELLVRAGQLGEGSLNDRAGGELPEYMRGLLLGGENDKGNRHAVTTAQFNPFVTPSDTLQQLAFLAKGAKDGQSPFNPDNPLSQTNPLIKAAVARFTGRDPFTGREMGPGEVIANSFPQRAFLPGGAAHQKDGVYEHRPSLQLAAYLGVPYRAADIERALDLQANPVRNVNAHGRTEFNDKGQRFIVGDDGRIYMDIGEAGAKRKRKPKSGGSGYAPFGG